MPVGTSDGDVHEDALAAAVADWRKNGMPETPVLEGAAPILSADGFVPRQQQTPSVFQYWLENAEGTGDPSRIENRTKNPKYFYEGIPGQKPIPSEDMLPPSWEEPVDLGK